MCATRLTEWSSLCMLWKMDLVICFFSRIFQRKISTNRLALIGMVGGPVGGQRPQLG